MDHGRLRTRRLPMQENIAKSPAEEPNEVDPVVLASAERDSKDKLLAISDLPDWLQDNEYLLTGYRHVSGSLKKSLYSLTYIHNDTVNIWSHALGSILFISIAIYVFTTEIPPRYAVATAADIIVCVTYFIGVAICFFLSATYHVILNHSAKYHTIGVQLDYLGILILMFSAMIPLIYYGFICDHILQRVYWSLLSTIAFACAVATMQPRFQSRKAKPIRAALYSGFGISSFLPIIHAIIKYGWKTQRIRMGLGWWGLVALFNLIGALAYACKFPERWYPRTFDIWGASHQIMHVAVVIAGLMHVNGCLQAFDYLHAHGKTC